MAVTFPVILLTRPLDAATRFAQEIAQTLNEVKVVVSPILQIEYAGELPGGAFVGVIFTSAYGVEGYLRTGGDISCPCWCVGEATAKAAIKAGMQAKSAGGDADALVRQIVEHGVQGPLLHVRGAHVRGDVAARLTKAGCTTREAVVYDQVVQVLSEEAKVVLNCGKPVIVPLFSPRSAREFARQHMGSAPIYVAAMSQAVAEALGGLQYAQIMVAERPDAAAMLIAVQGLFDAAGQLEGQPGAQ